MRNTLNKSHALYAAIDPVTHNKIFLFFRLFDIWKPFPVNYVDKNIKGGLGIMLDDILSGIYVIIILTFSLFFLGS